MLMLMWILNSICYEHPYFPEHIRLSVDVDLEVISSTKTGTWTRLVPLSVQLMSQCSAGTSRKKIKCIGNYNIGRTFEPDVRFLSGPWTGLPAGCGFLSGRGIRGSVRNWPNFIRTVLRHVRKFWPIFIWTYLRDVRVLSGVLTYTCVLKWTL